MRVLIVEDDPFIAMDLQDIVEGDGHHVIGSYSSVDGARAHLEDGVDYALLDVEVTDGKTFPIAQVLHDRHIPFAFVSASEHSDVPEPLRAAAFIAKPYEETTILRSMEAATES